MTSLQEQIRACQKCSLHKETTPLPFEGEPKSVVVVGEMPNPGEDEPFSDEIGQMVRGIVGDATYLNLVCCAKQGGVRSPSEVEVESCKPNFAAQIMAIKPDWIVLLGSYCLRVFYPDVNITNSRGKPFSITVAKGKDAVCFPSVSPFMAYHQESTRQQLEQDLKRFREMVDSPDWKDFVSDTCMGCGAWAENWTDEGVGLCRDHWTAGPITATSIRGWLPKNRPPAEETQATLHGI